MAGPIALAAALSRLVTVTCPHCGQKKKVERGRREHRICPRCHKRYPDPTWKRSRRR
jgi:ribosomal protein L37AE/L43A